MSDPALFDYACRLGDDGLVLGQRLSEWCGHAPALELDLTLANLGLDLIGQATAFLSVAGTAEGAGRDHDALAFHRDVLDFRNCLLVEQPNGDFAQTVARQFLYANFQLLLMEGLTSSRHADIAAIAGKAVKEVAYHVRFANEWTLRLGDGTPESRERLVRALDWLWRFTDELFDVDATLASAIDTGLAFDVRTARSAWESQVDAVLSAAGLCRPTPVRAVTGGRLGRHTEHLGHLLSELQFLPRAYPGLQW